LATGPQHGARLLYQLPKGAAAAIAVDAYLLSDNQV
jgi:hypothetical protein